MCLSLFPHSKMVYEFVTILKHLQGNYTLSYTKSYTKFCYTPASNRYFCTLVMALAPSATAVTI